MYQGAPELGEPSVWPTQVVSCPDPVKARSRPPAARCSRVLAGVTSLLPGSLATCATAAPVTQQPTITAVISEMLRFHMRPFPLRGASVIGRAQGRATPMGRPAVGTGRPSIQLYFRIVTFLASTNRLLRYLTCVKYTPLRRRRP